MMAQSHRLGHLEVSEAGHHRLGMLLGPLDEDTLEIADRIDSLIAGIADPQPKIGCDLVVPRPCRVKPSGSRADQLAEPMLDGHVNILEIDALWNAAALILCGDLVESLENRGRVRGTDDALLAQHCCVRSRGGDILTPQPL